MQNAIDGVTEYAPLILDTITRIQKEQAYVFSQYARITEAVELMFASIRESKVLPDIDEMRDCHETWGAFGWVIFDDMPRRIVKMKPESWSEANAIAMGCIDDAVIDRVFTNLREFLRDSSDINEAIALFREDHYKPCAMMVCSLIDGSRFKRSHKSKGQRLRDAREPLDRLQSQLSSACYSALSLSGTRNALCFFFQGGTDFDEKLEGELNRNYLLHGMANREVTREACIKLFMLLLSLERLMGLLQRDEEL